MTKSAVLALGEALNAGPPPPGNLATPIFAHGSLVAEMYQPTGVDRQSPHERDEIYVVARGTATFLDGDDAGAHTTRDVGPGTVVFVPAGRTHRFIGLSDDVAVWVFFYGPPGGEAAAGQKATQ